MVPSFLFLAVARAGDPVAVDPTPASALATTPAPAPASAAPSLSELAGTWYVTSTVAGREAVAWSCTKPPDSFEFDEGHLMIGVGSQSYGGAVTASTAGELLVLSTTLEACRTTKKVGAKWIDDKHQILEVTRCVGTPSRVRAVRNVASGVPVLRQCCDAAGKSLQYVPTDAPCPEGSVGQRPVPLAR